MGTHPIFESDFDCLTDFRKAKVDLSTLNMKCNNVFFLVFAAVAHADGNWGENNLYLCGQCKDNKACDAKTGTCADGCVEGWKNDKCDTPICNVDCGAEGECVNPDQCVCGYLYANSEDGGCYSLRSDGIRGFFIALFVLIVAITFCGCTQHQMSKKSNSE